MAVVDHGTFARQVRRAVNDDKGDVLAPLRAHVKNCNNGEQWETIPPKVAASYLERVITHVKTKFEEMPQHIKHSFYRLVALVAAKVREFDIESIRERSEIAWGRALIAREEASLA